MSKCCCDAILEQRQDELDLAVRVDLMRGRGEERVHQIGMAKSRAVLVLPKGAGAVDRETAAQPRIAVAEEAGHLVEKIGVQRSAERAEVLVADAVKREESGGEARLIDPVPLVEQAQRDAVADAGDAQRAVIGQAPAMEKVARALGRRRDGSEFAEGVFDVGQRVGVSFECAAERFDERRVRNSIESRADMSGNARFGTFHDRSPGCRRERIARANDNVSAGWSVTGNLIFGRPGV